MSNTEFILNFHGIGTPHSTVDFAEHPYWISETFFQQILDLVDSKNNANSIIWTFDDGNASDLAIAAARLAERKRLGKFFVLTGRFENPHYLSVSDVRSLSNLGMEVGLHGHDHVDWRTLSLDRLKAETIDAREVLAQAVGHPVSSVAIPFGAYNKRVINHLRRSGFETIYTSDGGASSSNQQLRNRTSIRADMTLADVSYILANKVNWKSHIRRRLSTTLRRHVI
jgi:peptidoglycan/xylan/chitin deacetylase (PgdA/CDA1 family)